MLLRGLSSAPAVSPQPEIQTSVEGGGHGAPLAGLGEPSAGAPRRLPGPGHRKRSLLTGFPGTAGAVRNV